MTLLMLLKFNSGTIVLENFTQIADPSPFHSLKWDERVNAYRGPAYRLPSIQMELLAIGHALERPPTKNQNPVFQSQDIQLRPYQEAALNAWQISGCRGVLALPTGSGKTHVAIAAIKIIARSTLILVPTRVLLHQWVSVLEKAGIAAGIFGDGVRHVEPVTVTTFESAYRHMTWLGDKFDFIVVDEVHHFGRGIRDEALEMSIGSLRLGLTATVPNDEVWHNRIHQILGPVVHTLNLHDLLGTYLSDFEVIRVHLELNNTERSIYEKEMEAFQAVHQIFREAHPNGSWKDFAFYASRTEAGRKSLKAFQAAQKILFFPEAKKSALSNILVQNRDNKVLIFTPDTATAYEISRRHLIMPITADIGRQERDDALNWFRNDEISSLVSCQVLNEGFDVPAANVAVILGGRLGQREHLQRVGRILRLKDNRKARIYELVCSRTLEVRQAKRRGQQLEP